ncbi:hypothetical protein N7535_008491 [Penicillium sp. DV-2018c]|nr:hypothetical protein N7461_002251 [Penicillium sp. DV-2018c]KAJ5563327.1 hypothetical protein N7535_008491 [Penicillium sp. DV-2018c]
MPIFDIEHDLFYNPLSMPPNYAPTMEDLFPAEAAAASVEIRKGTPELEDEADGQDAWKTLFQPRAAPASVMDHKMRVSLSRGTTFRHTTSTTSFTTPCTCHNTLPLQDWKIPFQPRAAAASVVGQNPRVIAAYTQSELHRANEFLSLSPGNFHGHPQEIGEDTPEIQDEDNDEAGDDHAAVCP